MRGRVWNQICAFNLQDKPNRFALMPPLHSRTYLYMALPALFSFYNQRKYPVFQSIEWLAQRSHMVVFIKFVQYCSALCSNWSDSEHTNRCIFSHLAVGGERNRGKVRVSRKGTLKCTLCFHRMAKYGFTLKLAIH